MESTFAQPNWNFIIIIIIIVIIIIIIIILIETTRLKRKKEGNVLFNDALNTFIYGYMVSDIWLRTIQKAIEQTRCRHYMGCSFRLAARVLLYAPSHRQDSTYHGICYTSHGALAGTNVKIKINAL